MVSVKECRYTRVPPTWEVPIDRRLEAPCFECLYDHSTAETRQNAQYARDATSADDRGQRWKEPWFSAPRIGSTGLHTAFAMEPEYAECGGVLSASTSFDANPGVRRHEPVLVAEGGTGIDDRLPFAFKAWSLSDKYTLR